MSLWENDIILIGWTYGTMAEFIPTLLIMSILETSKEGWKNILMYETWKAVCKIVAFEKGRFLLVFGGRSVKVYSHDSEWKESWVT